MLIRFGIVSVFRSDIEIHARDNIIFGIAYISQNLFDHAVNGSVRRSKA